jgi:glycolate oxidase
VIRARSVADVQRAMAAASRERTPIVVRGAGTGLAGGALAGPDRVVLDVSGLDRILAVDAPNGLARVEPGVTAAELDRAAAPHGLFYPPDPASVEISTIGGNIATNAGGLRATKYGVTRDSVLGLDVVLADGRLLRLGHDTVKGVVGLDLVSLFVGSEGTLGVIVGATVRLLPRPTRTATAAAYFASVADAARAAGALLDAGLRPVTLELVDGPTLAAIDDLRATWLHGRGAAFLLVQTDGAGADEEIAAAAAVLHRTALSVETTTDPEVARSLAAARRDALPAIEARGRVLIEDIVVPRSRLAEAVEGVHALAAANDVEVYVFAHAADGNLHPILVVGPDAGPTDLPPALRRTADGIFGLALALGGTISGEHGVGLLKRDWLERELGPDVVALQRQIKHLLDPYGILNPGKAL